MSSEGISKGTTFTLKFDCFQESSNTQSKSCIIDICEAENPPCTKSILSTNMLTHSNMILHSSCESSHSSFLGSSRNHSIHTASNRLQFDVASQQTDHAQIGSFSVVAAPAQPHAELNESRSILELRVLIADDVSACRKVLGILLRVFRTLSATDLN